MVSANEPKIAMSNYALNAPVNLPIREVRKLFQNVLYRLGESAIVTRHGVHKKDVHKQRSFQSHLNCQR